MVSPTEEVSGFHPLPMLKWISWLTKTMHVLKFIPRCSWSTQLIHSLKLIWGHDTSSRPHQLITTTLQQFFHDVCLLIGALKINTCNIIISFSDESMIDWWNSFCQDWMCVPRKPHPFGNEYHKICMVIFLKGWQECFV